MKVNRKNSYSPSNRFKYLAKSLGVFILTLCFAIAVFPTSAQARVMQYQKGNPADVNPLLSGMVYDLGGGGRDVDPAIQ